MAGPRASNPPEDPIQAGYGVGALVVEPEAPSSPEVPPEVTAGGGATKWPRDRAFAYLAACPKVPTYIPMTPDDTALARPAYHNVGWNGWMIAVPKGRTVYVPAPIAAMIEAMLQPKRTQQMLQARAIDMMLVTAASPGGLLLDEYSDPVAVELVRRGAPLRMS